jgi:site-specific DNA-methyltransferase (adenine-specific)
MKEKNLSEIVSSLSPFGLGSAERGHSHCQTGDIVLYSSKGKSYIPKEKIISGKEYLDYYHVMMSKVTSEHANEPTRDGTFKVISRVQPIKPNEACTFSYFLIGNFKTEDECKNLLSYLSTRFARFLLLQSISSINISKDKFQFVPLQDFSKPWTDEELYKKYGLTDEEIQFIESMIRPME